MLKSLFPEPRELISDSLKDSVSDEELSKIYGESFIFVLLESLKSEDSLLGMLIGLEVSEFLKIDIKLGIDVAFQFLSNYFLLKQENRMFNSVVLNLNESAFKIKGPSKIVSIKIVELDSKNKSCVLAIDLLNEV